MRIGNKDISILVKDIEIKFPHLFSDWRIMPATLAMLVLFSSNVYTPNLNEGQHILGIERLNSYEADANRDYDAKPRPSEEIEYMGIIIQP